MNSRCPKALASCRIAFWCLAFYRLRCPAFARLRARGSSRGLLFPIHVQGRQEAFHILRPFYRQLVARVELRRLHFVAVLVKLRLARPLELYHPMVVQLEADVFVVHLLKQAPIVRHRSVGRVGLRALLRGQRDALSASRIPARRILPWRVLPWRVLPWRGLRSEEHTSELQ